MESTTQRQKCVVTGLIVFVRFLSPNRAIMRSECSTILRFLCMIGGTRRSRSRFANIPMRNVRAAVSECGRSALHATQWGGPKPPSLLRVTQVLKRVRSGSRLRTTPSLDGAVMTAKRTKIQTPMTKALQRAPHQSCAWPAGMKRPQHSAT